MLEQSEIDPALIDRLIADLAVREGFPEEAVRWAMADRDLACAASRVILMRAQHAAAAGEPDEMEGAPLFALVLLGYHKDEASSELLRTLLYLPHDAREAMLGDGFLGHMGPVLWAVSGGDPSPLIALLREGHLDPIALGEVVRAIHIGVSEGRVDRHDVQRLLVDRLARALADADSLGGHDAAWAADVLAQAVADLAVEGEDEEYLASVERVVERGELMEYSSVPYFREDLARTKDEVIEMIGVREGRHYPPIPHRLYSPQTGPVLD